MPGQCGRITFDNNTFEKLISGETIFLDVRPDTVKLEISLRPGNFDFEVGDRRDGQIVALCWSRRNDHLMTKKPALGAGFVIYGDHLLRLSKEATERA